MRELDSAIFYALGMQAEIIREGNSFSAERAKAYGERISKAYWDRVAEVQASVKHGDF